jgi:hypothetical protein
MHINWTQSLGLTKQEKCFFICMSYNKNLHYHAETPTCWLLRQEQKWQQVFNIRNMYVTILVESQEHFNATFSVIFWSAIRGLNYVPWPAILFLNRHSNASVTLGVSIVMTTSLANLLRNTAHSCSRHGVVAAILASERPGSVIPVSNTFTLLGIYSWLQSLRTF